MTENSAPSWQQHYQSKTTKFYQNLEILSEHFNFYKKIRAFPIIDHSYVPNGQGLWKAAVEQFILNMDSCTWVVSGFKINSSTGLFHRYLLPAYLPVYLHILCKMFPTKTLLNLQFLVVTKGHTYLKLQLIAAGLFKYVCPFVTSRH